MKRKLKWLAIVLAVLLLGFGAALLSWPRDRVTAESWQKIRIGMTEDEVAEILGGPGMTSKEQYFWLEKELGRSPFEFENPRLEQPKLPLRGFWVCEDRIWVGRRGCILIQLDQDKHVSWKGFRGVRWRNGDILDRVRDWLGW